MKSLNISVSSCNRCFGQGIHELTEIARDFRKSLKLPASKFMKSLVLNETCFMTIKSFIHTIKNLKMVNSWPLKLQINFISAHSVGDRVSAIPMQ